MTRARIARPATLAALDADSPELVNFYRVAGRALHPQALRDRARAAFSLDPRRDDFLKPGHVDSRWFWPAIIAQGGSRTSSGIPRAGGYCTPSR